MLETLFAATIIGSVLVLFAAFSSLIAFRLGAPLLLLFLCIGLLVGEDGLGLYFDDAPLAYAIGSIALAIILFDSGFNTSLATFRQAAAPAITLATVGVLLTAGLFGLAASALLGVPTLEGLLLGSIVASTDAAAVFFLLRAGGVNLRDKVRSLLEIESGTNDPMAIFLTIALVAVIGEGGGLDALGLDVLVGFMRQMGLGLAIGLLGGIAVRMVVSRVEVDRGLLPIVTLSFALFIFGLTGYLDGSGYLAVYVAGIYAGNSALKPAENLRRFQDGLTWLAQIVMFLFLGLLATPHEFGAILLPAVGLALFLIFVARPLAVWLCLIPFDFQHREEAFVALVGLRGAVSILLAIVPLIAEIPNARVFFNTAFIIVLASLLLQGWTLAFMARRFGLIVPRRIGPVEKVELELPGSANHELLVYHVVEASPVARGERIPRWATPSLVIRDGRSMKYQFAGRIQAGDYVYLFINPRLPRLLDRLFASPVELSRDDEEFFGEFTVDPSRPAELLAVQYDVRLGREERAQTIAELMAARLGGHAEYGDRVPLAPVELIVRDLAADGRVGAVGLSLMPEEGRGSLPLFINRRDVVRALRRAVRLLRGRSGPAAQSSRLSDGTASGAASSPADGTV